MRALVLVTLVAFAAQAQEVEVETLPSDKPLITAVKSGKVLATDGKIDREVIVPKGVYLNELGIQKLDQRFKGMQVQLVEQEAQNAILRTRVDEIAAEPKLTVGAVILIAAGALVVGAGVSAGVVYAIKK